MHQLLRPTLHPALVFSSTTKTQFHGDQWSGRHAPTSASKDFTRSFLLRADLVRYGLVLLVVNVVSYVRAAATMDVQVNECNLYTGDVDDDGEYHGQGVLHMCEDMDADNDGDYDACLLYTSDAADE